nr:CEACAM55 [Equus caballus]
METPSATTHRGHILHGFLLAVSFLTFWNLPTSAKPIIESVPTNAITGMEVLLFVYNLPEDLAGCAWYKGDKVDPKLEIASFGINTSKITPGPAYTSQHKLYPDGSLLFRNVIPENTGYYTLLVTRKNSLVDTAIGELHIY